MNKNATPLETQLLLECNAMVKHAFSYGLKVPEVIVRVLEFYSVRNQEGEKPTPQSSLPGSDSLKTSSPDIGQLALIHGQLSDIVAPAKPIAILLLENEASGSWKFLGAIPFIRRMLTIAILCLILFVAISTTTYVNGKPERFSLFQNDGISLVFNLAFLLVAAGVGASFSNLFMANRYVTERTFDPTFEATYWTRFVLGLLAGMMLATLVPIDQFSTDANVGGFGKPLLSLIGGFSSIVVYRILNRLTTTLESLIQGDAKDEIAVREEAAKSRFSEKLSKERMTLSGTLTKLQNKISSGIPPTELQQELARIQESLINATAQINIPTCSTASGESNVKTSSASGEIPNSDA